MDAPSGAGRAFAEALGVPPSPAMGAEIDAAIARARDRWPDLPLDPPALARYVAARLDGARLADACVEDLLLAKCCLEGDRSALAAFDALLAQAPSWVRRPASAPLMDDLRQHLRTSLLVGPEAQLATYRGRGALHAWLRVAAVRALSRLEAGGARAERVHEAAAREPDDARARRLDPERALAGEHAEPAVTEALRAAFASLTPKQRALLRLRHGGRVSDEKIAKMYGVHQSTATRWIGAAHEAVAEAVRRDLEMRLRLRAEEVDSVLSVVRSRLDLSLSELLRTQARHAGRGG